MGGSWPERSSASRSLNEGELRGARSRALVGRHWRVFLVVRSRRAGGRGQAKGTGLRVGAERCLSWRGKCGSRFGVERAQEETSTQHGAGPAHSGSHPTVGRARRPASHGGAFVRVQPLFGSDLGEKSQGTHRYQILAPCEPTRALWAPPVPGGGRTVATAIYWAQSATSQLYSLRITSIVLNSYGGHILRLRQPATSSLSRSAISSMYRSSSGRDALPRAFGSGL